MKSLARLREKYKLSQGDLAEKIGVSQQTVSKYERGLLEPNLETLRILADYFDVTVDYLLGRTADNTPDSLSLKDQKDIAKDLEIIMHNLDQNESGPLFYGGELDETDKELLKNALENALTIVKIKNKEKYNPHKNKP